MQTNPVTVPGDCPFLRLKILDITKIDQDKIKLSGEDPSKRVEVRPGMNEYDNDRVQIIVAGVWTKLEFARDQIIHLRDVPAGPEANHFNIDNTRGLLIIEPDNLIACTAVTSALYCERKTWLDYVFAKRYQTSRSLLIGKLVHQMFSNAIKQNVNDSNLLAKQLDEILSNELVMLEIYAAAWDINIIRNACLGYAPTVGSWVDRYKLSWAANENSTLAHNKNICVRLRETCDIEDLMKSSNYGLKGKVDVLGNFRVYNKQTRRFRDEQRAVLEVKTGISRLCRTHMAQVELYNMLSEESEANNTSGYLTYLQGEPNLYEVNNPNHNIKRDLCMKRNQLNAYFKDFFLGPATLVRPSSCLTCDRLTECQLTGKIYDLDEDKFPHMAWLEREATGHLDARFIDFFARQHERLTKLIHGNCHQTSRPCPTSMRVLADQVEGFPIRFLQLASADEQNGVGQDRQVSLVRSKRFIENFLASVESTRKVQSQPDVKRMKLDDTKSAIRVKPFEFSGNLHMHCRVSIKLDRDVSEQASRHMDEQANYQVVTGTLCELKRDKLTIKLVNASSRPLLKPDLIYRLDRLVAPQHHNKSADVELMRQVLVLLLGRASRREVRVRKLISDPDYRPQLNQELMVSLRMNECLGLTEMLSERGPLVFEAVATNNYFVISERSLAPNKPKLDKLILAMVELIISLDRRVLIVAQDVDSLIDLMDSLKEICKFILVSDPIKPQKKLPLSRAQTQFASNIVRVSKQQGSVTQPDSVVEKYNAFIRAHELAPVIVSTFHASRSNLSFAKQTFDYCIAYDCDKTELLMCLAPMFCCDRHIIVDIDDGQCGPVGGGSSHNSNFLNTSLGEHLRDLRPEVYQAHNDGGGGNT